MLCIPPVIVTFNGASHPHTLCFRTLNDNMETELVLTFIVCTSHTGL